MKPRLRTERLLIRPLEDHDLAAIMARSAQQAVARYMRWDTDSWSEAERVTNWITFQRGLGLDEVGTFIEFALELDGCNVGDIALKRLSREHRDAELGFSLEPALQGQGLMTEAALALLDWAFRHCNLHRTSGVCDTRNTRSQRLMARLGMRREAHHHACKWVRGAWIDEYVYAITQPEWLGIPVPDYEILTEPL